MNTQSVEVSNEEGFYLWMMRLNRVAKIKGFTKAARIGKVKITFQYREKSNLWGRFGGGWNWKLGFQAGSNCLIIELLIASLRIEKVQP